MAKSSLKARPAEPDSPTKPAESVRFVTTYTNRYGRRMHAPDYGYEAWPFRPRAKGRSGSSRRAAKGARR